MADKMAEGGTKEVLCRYFMNNVCKKGDQCQFSHDPNMAQPSLVCRYFLKGTCAYGDKCRYEHTFPEYMNKTPVSSTSLSPQSPPMEAPEPNNIAKEVQEPVVPSHLSVGVNLSLPVGGNGISTPHTMQTLTPTQAPGLSNAQQMIQLVSAHLTHFVAQILDTFRIPHTLPKFANKKNVLTLNDAHSSSRNLSSFLHLLGVTLTRCMNCGNSSSFLELGNLLVRFWAMAKEPCPNITFTTDDLTQIVISPEGRQFLDITLAQYHQLLAALKPITEQKFNSI